MKYFLVIFGAILLCSVVNLLIFTSEISFIQNHFWQVYTKSLDFGSGNSSLNKTDNNNKPNGKFCDSLDCVIVFSEGELANIKSALSNFTAKMNILNNNLMDCDTTGSIETQEKWVNFFLLTTSQCLKQLPTVCIL